MCMLVPEKVRPLDLLVAGITGICQKSDLNPGNELFLTAQPCL